MRNGFPAAVRLAAAAALALALGACAINDRIEQASRIDYKSAGKVATLDIPPDLAAPASDGRYTVPERDASARTFSSYERGHAAERPGGSTGAVLPAVPGAHIERAGSERWLVVDAPPERVWPVLREFWQDNGFTVQTESPATGVMETDWAENRAKIPQDFIRRTIGRALENFYSTPERDKFRTRLERAGDTTEIYISHRGMQEVYVTEGRDRTMWQPRPPDPGLEAEFLNRLLLKFTPEAGATQTAAAGSAEAGALVRLVSDDSGQRLDVAEGFDRAWRRIGLALDRGGFTVEDRDRSQGLYFVRYVDPEVEGGRIAEKPGFFTRLFSSAEPRADAANRFRVHVAEAGTQSRVTVLAQDGKPVPDVDRPTAARILALLRDQLK